MKVLITGATGFVGTPLTAALRGRGDVVTALTRDPRRTQPGVRFVAADLESPGDWCQELAACDAVVHLAGESIGGARWDARHKQRVRDSRVESTRVIVETLAALPATQRPRVLVVASGVDVYPFADEAVALGGGDDDVTEADPPGETFLARVCAAWEREAQGASALGVRVVRMRTGLVLGPGGGPLAKMLAPFRFGLGGRLGSGRQWWSWIHLDDAVAAYATAVHDERWAGPINLVAPRPVRQRDFAKALGGALGRPALLPAPAFALRAAVGELADYLLAGRPVVPAALTRLGFSWRYPELEGALRAAT